MLGYIYSKITGKRSPRRGSQNEGDGLFFAGEDGHAERGDGHEGHGRGDDIIGAGGGVLLVLGLGGVLGAVGDDDDAAAVPGSFAQSSAFSVKVFSASLLPSTTRTALLGTTSSLGVQGVRGQYSSAVSVAMQQVRKS